MNLCKGIRYGTRSLCHGTTYRCRHCGSAGCQDPAPNGCTAQVFHGYLCLNCGMVGGRGEALEAQGEQPSATAGL